MCFGIVKATITYDFCEKDHKQYKQKRFTQNSNSNQKTFNFVLWRRSISIHCFCYFIMFLLYFIIL